MAEKYILKDLKDLNDDFAFWDSLVINSQQCSIYLSSVLLNNINRKVKFGTGEDAGVTYTPLNVHKRFNHRNISKFLT